MRLRSARRSAFTLLEVLVVVAILVVLAGVASVYVFRYLDDSKKDRVKVDLQALTKACEAYKLRNDDFPPSLSVLVQPTDGGKPFLDGGPQALNDPWGKPYQYDPSGGNSGGLKPDISTTSPDGVQINNWSGNNR
jgi:general secretion pathway protein G